MKLLTEDSFEQILKVFMTSSDIDLGSVTFVDPYGMIGLLEFGEVSISQNVHKTIYLPESEEVLKYLERMDFFAFANKYFTLIPSIPILSERYLRSSYSDVLLEITPIEKSDDIHHIVGKVKNRALSILSKHLNYNEHAINVFIVALSEVCQNIIEHSETTGYVGIQKYYFHKINKNVVKIAVMDTGIGFKESLTERFSLKNDLDSIEKALLHRASRYADKGRGHGLNAVRLFVNQWNGKISIRSGTAKLSIIPDWTWGREKDSHLTYFPGAQINILLPEV